MISSAKFILCYLTTQRADRDSYMACSTNRMWRELNYPGICLGGLTEIIIIKKNCQVSRSSSRNLRLRPPSSKSYVLLTRTRHFDVCVTTKCPKHSQGEGNRKNLYKDTALNETASRCKLHTPWCTNTYASYAWLEFGAVDDRTAAPVNAVAVNLMPGNHSTVRGTEYGVKATTTNVYVLYVWGTLDQQGLRAALSAPDI